MSTLPPAGAGNFEKTKKQRSLEVQQAMVQALKQGQYDAALQFAETGLQLDPTNRVLTEFKALLDEKAKLDADTDDEEAEGASPPGASGSQEETTSDEDDEDEGESEESSEESSEEEEEDVEPKVVVNGVDPETGGLKGLPAPSALARAQRSKLRASLAKSIAELKQVEKMKALMADDPLLAA